MDSIDAQGNPKRVKAKPWIFARSEGPGKIGKRQAEKMAAEKMAEVNRGGSTTAVTIAEFVAQRFLPDHVAGLTGNGQKHYSDVLKHVESAFGGWALPDCKAQHVMMWLQAKAGQGYSANYVRHMRNVLHAIYEHAYRCGIYEGRNPAAKLKIPKSAREAQPTQPYTLEELQAILPHLDSPLWEMFVLGACTSMHAAELAGLRCEHVNLSDRVVHVLDKPVPPGALYVCESLAKGHRTSGKTKQRRRILPIPEILRERLAAMIGGRPGSEPVFYMPRSLKTQGRACFIDTGNISSRRFKPLEKKLAAQGIHVRICWHRLRATNATLTGQMLMDDASRVAMMGHGSLKMTERYEDPFEKQRRAANAIAAGLVEDHSDEEGGPIQ